MSRSRASSAAFDVAAVFAVIIGVVAMACPLYVFWLISQPKEAPVRHPPAELAAVGPILDYVAEQSSRNDVNTSVRLYDIPITVEPEIIRQPHPADFSPVDEDVMCVALVVFGESRGESYLGQAAVAHTVWQRSAAHAGDACEAAQAPSQYQFTLSADPWVMDGAAWDRAVRVAREVRDEEYDLATCHGARYFHSAAVERPRFLRKHEELCRVDNHVFYR